MNPQMKLLSIHDEAYKYVSEYCKNHESLSFLDVGGGDGNTGIAKGVREQFDIIYNNMEIDSKIISSELIVGDICNCPQIPDDSYDIVFSHNVFEHLRTPWTAAEECIRINKLGGLNVHIMPFVYAYHECPIDCFRYTHTGVKMLFETSGKTEELITGYDKLERRRYKKRESNKEQWVESWLMLYVGKKIKGVI